MDLKKAHNLTQKFTSNSHHYGRIEYTPELTDEITFVQQNGRDLVIYLDIKREGSTPFKMRFGDAYNFIQKIILKDIRPNGNKIPNKVYTSQGFVSTAEFQEAKDLLDSLPQPIDYEHFLTESVQTRDLYDGIYFLETGEIVLQFKVLTKNRFPNSRYSDMYQYIGKRLLVKVLLNEDNKFEVVGLPRVKNAKDKVLAPYPDAILEETINEFIQNNIKD